MHRRRRYGIREAMEEYPVSLFAFDILYVDGEDLTQMPRLVRRRAILEAIRKSEMVKVAKYTITDKIEELERFFLEAIEDGCEGLVRKSTAGDSIYEA
jgi:DNA ligase-1